MKFEYLFFRMSFFAEPCLYLMRPPGDWREPHSNSNIDKESRDDCDQKSKIWERITILLKANYLICLVAGWGYNYFSHIILQLFFANHIASELASHHPSIKLNS